MRVRQLAALVFLIFALIPGGALAWRARHFEHLGYFHDGGMYWIAAKSLAEGTGYRILSLPGMPYQTKYPPGLPFLLSLVWKVSPQFPANLPWAMLIAAAMLPAFAWVSVRLLESWGCSRCAAMVVCAFMVLNPYIVLFGVSLMPELLVATLLGCCLLAAQKAVQQDSTRIALASGILGGLAYLTKTAAMPLLIAGPIWFATPSPPREPTASKPRAWSGSAPMEGAGSSDGSRTSGTPTTSPPRADGRTWRSPPTKPPRSPPPTSPTSPTFRCRLR